MSLYKVRLQAMLMRLDKFQQTHSIIGFPYAVHKKYSDSNGSYRVALLTYYGFLSLLPLLLVTITIVHIWLSNNPDLQQATSSSINRYFPLLGQHLQNNISTLKGTGFGLAAGLLITLFGAKGGADTLRYIADSAWLVPANKRTGFPKNNLKSLAIIGAVGTGFAATIAALALARRLGAEPWSYLLLSIASAVVLIGTIVFAFYIGASQKIAAKKLLPGAIVAGISIQLLLIFGDAIVSSQLKNLSPLYGTFALVLGLFFWLHLLAQVVVYAAEINAVHQLKLWPRSLTGDQPAAGDKHLGEQLSSHRSDHILPL